MDNHTAPELLEAVGYDWHKDYALVQCPQCKNHRYYCVTGNTWHRFDCSRPDTSQIAPTYTGPALGTPELDWILLAAGVKRLREANIDRLFTILGKLPDHEFHNAALTLLVHDTPGHALARAIREVNHA